MLTLKNFKLKMIEKALKNGSIWENFGQKELQQLKDKYNYSPYWNQYSDAKTQKTGSTIEELDRWASHFDLSQLKK